MHSQLSVLILIIYICASILIIFIQPKENPPVCSLCFIFVVIIRQRTGLSFCCSGHIGRCSGEWAWPCWTQEANLFIGSRSEARSPVLPDSTEVHTWNVQIAGAVTYISAEKLHLEEPLILVNVRSSRPRRPIPAHSHLPEPDGALVVSNSKHGDQRVCGTLTLDLF